MPSPQAARAAAEASMQQRRSYSAAGASAPLLSKRHERQLREQGGLDPGEASLASAVHGHPPPAGPAGCGAGGGPGDAAAAVAWPGQLGLGIHGRPHRQPQPQPLLHLGDGFFEHAEEEEEEDGMWEDLQGLAAWRSSDAGGGGGSRGRSPSALGPAAEPGQQHAQHQHAPAAAALASGSLAVPHAEAPLAELPTGRSSPAGSGSGSSSGRVIIHADVDAFYVQVGCTPIPDPLSLHAHQHASGMRLPASRRPCPFGAHECTAPKLRRVGWCRLSAWTTPPSLACPWRCNNSMQVGWCSCALHQCRPALKPRQPAA